MRIFLTILVLLLVGWLIWVFVIRGFTPAPEDAGTGPDTPAVTGDAVTESRHDPG